MRLRPSTSGRKPASSTTKRHDVTFLAHGSLDHRDEIIERHALSINPKTYLVHGSVARC